MKQTRRRIYRGGYVQFENLTYQGEHLASYAGESVVLRYDPRDVTTVFVYRQEGSNDVFLARAFAQNLEAEEVGLDEVKAISRKVRQEGKTLSNHSILKEIHDRQMFMDQKKSRKQRQKEEQMLAHEPQVSVTITTEKEEVLESQPLRERAKVVGYEQLLNDYGW
jgi:putative transposase